MKQKIELSSCEERDVIVKKFISVCPICKREFLGTTENLSERYLKLHLCQAHQK